MAPSICGGTGEVQSWGPINWAAFLTSKRVQPTPPQCRPGLLVLEPLWVWPLLSLQVPFYPYRTCFTIQTYQGLVQLRMTTIRPRKLTIGLNLHLRKSPSFTYFFSLPIVNSEGKKAKKTADVRSTYFSTSSPSVP